MLPGADAVARLVGFLELLLYLLSLIFTVAVIAGAVKLIQRSTRERTIAPLVEENRRLREEIAALRGDKPRAEPEV